MIPNVLTARQNLPGCGRTPSVAQLGTTSVDGDGYLDGPSAGATTTPRPVICSVADHDLPVVI